MGQLTEEEQLYAELAAWARFKKEVIILQEYKFKKEQLLGYIEFTYDKRRGTWT